LHVLLTEPGPQIKWWEDVDVSSPKVQTLVTAAQALGFEFAQDISGSLLNDRLQGLVSAVQGRGTATFLQVPPDIVVPSCSNDVVQNCVVPGITYNFEVCKDNRCITLGSIAYGDALRPPTPSVQSNNLFGAAVSPDVSGFDVDLEPNHPEGCEVAYYQLFMRSRPLDAAELRELERRRSDPAFEYGVTTFHNQSMDDENQTEPVAECKFGYPTCPPAVGVRAVCSPAPTIVPATDLGETRSVLLSIFVPFIFLMFIMAAVAVYRGARRGRNHVVLEVEANWQLRPSQLVLGTHLAKGQFGTVFKAVLTGFRVDGARKEDFEVAVKVRPQAQTLLPAQHLPAALAACRPTNVCLVASNGKWWSLTGCVR